MNAVTIAQKAQQQQVGVSQAIDSVLTHESVLQQFAKLLPDKQASQAERFIKRFKLHFAGLKPSMRDKLEQCTVPSLVSAVLEAASYGFAIDGHFAYIVPYKNVAQCQLSYLGYQAMARREGIVKDIYARIVCDGDGIELWDEDGIQRCSYRRALVKRGKPVGALCVAVLNQTTAQGKDMIRTEFMDMAELAKIRACAKGSSPAWETWPQQMQKKAVIRRLIRQLIDDPSSALAGAIEVEDERDSVVPVRTVEAQPVSDLLEHIKADSLPEPQQDAKQEEPEPSVDPAEPSIVEQFAGMTEGMDKQQTLQVMTKLAVNATQEEEQQLLDAFKQKFPPAEGDKELF